MNTILIVDDHAGFRLRARALLEAEGFSVVGEAADGPSGLRAARSLRPDLLLLDLGLPDLDGLEVLRVLRERGVAVPVIVITSRTDPRDRATALELGVREYLTKPFAWADVWAAVRRCVTAREQA
jgi:two-component system KDP operon response regulator KdpE